MTAAKKTTASPDKRRTAAERASSAKTAAEENAEEGVETDAEYEVIRPIAIEGEQRMVGDRVRLSSVNASELVSHGYVRKA